MYGSNTAARIIPHLSSNASAALSVMIEAADGEVPLPVKPSLPPSSATRFRRGPVHRAVLAASSAVTEEEQAVFAADSRVTVLRALAGNPSLTPRTAGLLAKKALTTDGVMPGIVRVLNARDLFEARDELGLSSAAPALRNVEMDFARSVASRGDIEEVSLVLSADPVLAGAMLAVLASGDAPVLSVTAAADLTSDSTPALRAALFFSESVSLEFASLLGKTGTFEIESSSRFSRSSVTCLEGVPQVLFSLDNSAKTAAALANSKVHPSDVSFVVSSVLPSLLFPDGSTAEKRRSRNLISTFVRQNASSFSDADIDMVWDLFDGMASDVQATSEVEEAAKALLRNAGTPQRVRMFQKASANLFAEWVHPRTVSSWVCADTSDISEWAPRPLEVTSILQGKSDEWLLRVANSLSHRFLPDPLYEWWGELADGLGGFFFRSRSEAFLAYTVRRLEEAIGDDEQAWRMVILTIDNFHGSLSDLCLLAQLSTKEPSD